MRSARPSVSVVLVSYDSHELPDAVASIAAWAEVVIVEQHPRGSSVRDASRLRPDARVLQAGANRGFGAGCNLGAANARGEVLVFLNPDATLDEESLERLSVAALADGAGLVGPSILDADGSRDTRARNWSTAAMDALHLVVPRRLVPARWQRDIEPGDPRYAEGGAVPYVQGSCMAIRRAAFFEAGGFDERFFLYGEEEDLARRLVAQGRVSRLLPEATAKHAGGTTTAGVSHFATEQLFRSHVLIYRKHSGWAHAYAGGVLLIAVLAVLLITAPIRKLTPWRKRETPAWCRAALRGVLAGLRSGAPVRVPGTTTGDAWPPSRDEAESAELGEEPLSGRGPSETL